MTLVSFILRIIHKLHLKIMNKQDCTEDNSNNYHLAFQLATVGGACEDTQIWTHRLML